jgi:cell division protein FtsN
MARDYARNRSSRRTARTGKITPRGGRRPSTQLGFSKNRQPSFLHPVMWMISGIVVGLLIAGIIYIKRDQHSTTPPAPALAHEKNSKHTKWAKRTDKITKANDTDSTEIDSTTDADATSTPEDNDDTTLTESSSDSTDNTTKTTTTSQTQAKKKTAESQPHYDFYTMLPKDNVENVQPVEKEKPQTKSVTATHYQLQVASMTKFQDAVHLKAQLILQGYNASISKQVRHGVTRFRVVLGPFANAKAAATQQVNLRKNHINSLLLPV